MVEQKEENAVQKMKFEKEKLELIRLRIQNKFYERSDVLEEVAAAILQKNISAHHTSS